jgi:hypothetical protein
MWFKRNICEKSPVSFGRSGPRRIVSQVRAEASSLALCRTPETIALANPRWNEPGDQWTLIIKLRRCVPSATMHFPLVGVRRHLRCAIILWFSYPRFAALTPGDSTRAASLMLTCINCYRLPELLARLIHVRKRLYSSVDLFLSDSNDISPISAVPLPPIFWRR